MTFTRSCCLTDSNEPHSPGCKEAGKGEMPLPSEPQIARARDLSPRLASPFTATAMVPGAASAQVRNSGGFAVAIIPRVADADQIAETIADALNAWTGRTEPVALPHSEGIDERIESAFCGGNLTGHAVRQTLGNWGLEVVESADWDPPVCRLQFPDGSVPGNAREAAEGWHRIAEERLAEIRALTAAVAGINESERAHTEKFGLYGASCDELRPDPNAGSFVDHDEKLGAGCDDVAVEPPTPTEPPVECAAMEVSQDAARDPLGAVTQAMTSDAPARPDVATEPQGEDELPDPRRMPFEPQARVRSLDNPWLGALIVAAQEYGSNEEGWSVTAIPVGGRTAIKFAAESLEPVDTGRQLVMCLNGDMIDMARFAEELAQQTIDRTLQAFVMKERAGRPPEGSAGGFAGQD
jgi:hypothetical protein